MHTWPQRASKYLIAISYEHLWGEIPAPIFLLNLSASEDFPSV